MEPVPCELPEQPSPAVPGGGKGYRWGLSGVYCAGFVGLGLIISAPGPCLLAMATRTGSSLDQLSGIFVGRALGYFVGTLAGGSMLDKAPTHGNRLIAAGLILSGLATLAVPFSTGLWQLMGLMGAAGLAMGVLDTAGNVLLIRLHGPAAVEPYMQTLHFCFGLGACLAPLVLRATLGNGLVYDQAYFGFGIFLCAVGLTVLWLRSPMPQPQPEASAAGVYWPVVLGTAVFLGLYVGLEVSFGAMLHSFSVEGPAQMQPAQGELITAVYWAGIAAGRLLAVPLSLVLAPEPMLVLDLVGCVLAAGLMMVAGQVRSVLWASAAAFGASMASIFPTALNLAGTVIDVDGQAATFMVVGAAGGEMVLPLLAGVLFEKAGPTSMPGFTLAVSALQAGCFYVLAVRVRRFKVADEQLTEPRDGLEKVELTSMDGDDPITPRHGTLE